MLRIGFIDYFLDEWHANNYPAWIRAQAKALGMDTDVCYAWAEMDKSDGLSTAAWCEAQGVRLCDTQEAVIDACDALVVLSPDHCERHEHLGRLALMSGKPVYMDKTFSPDIASGQRMFDLAGQHGTPLCSSSALRFAPELVPYLHGGADLKNRAPAEDFTSNPCVSPKDVLFAATTGPGSPETYTVHQAEMIVAVFGDAPDRVLVTGSPKGRQVLLDYGDRQASMLQMPCQDFTVSLAFAGDESCLLRPDGYFDQLIASMLTFFRTGVPPVPRSQTMAVMALLDAAGRAARMPGHWVTVSAER